MVDGNWKDGVIFFTEAPPIGTTGWKECVYGEWIFLIGLYLFKENFSKGWEEGENGGWKLEGWMFRNWMDGWHDW